MYDVQGKYSESYGWEDIDPGYATKSEAVEAKHVYDANEPEYPHRVRSSK